MQNAPSTAEPCVIVIFGASGDLTKRKLIPALYDQDRQGRLPKKSIILGVARTAKTDDAWREELNNPTDQWVKKGSAAYDEKLWQDFRKRIFYQPGDGSQVDSMKSVVDRVNKIAADAGILRGDGSPNVLFYLSTAPELFEPIIDNIGACGVVTEGHRWCSLNRQTAAWQRIIIEKPFGTDLASTVSLNRCLGRVFDEEAIFRIDHYLGKELVQNLLVMRFGNSIFEPLWNRQYIDHVQVTAAETVTVGSRAANFYDTAGALRDMIQSHLLQVVELMAMEPPSSYDGAAIMREKIKLIDSSPTLREEQVPHFGVFGRYGKGESGKPDDVAYVDEKGVVESRKTETFAAICLHFDNWRWAGVPFFVRSGKRMATKLTEIVVQFKKPPLDLFAKIDPAMADRPANRLIMNIAPREGISLRIEGKVPGSAFKIASAKLDLDYLNTFGGEVVEAYGPLIVDAIRGDRTLYKHRDEVEGGWRVCEPFLNNRRLREHIETYSPASWGPPGSDALIARSAAPNQPRAWHNPQSNDLR